MSAKHATHIERRIPPVGKRAKQAKRDAHNHRAGIGVTTAQRSTDQQSPTTPTATATRDTQTPPTPLPTVKRLKGGTKAPAKPTPVKGNTKPRPGDPSYRGPRDVLTGEAIGTVNAHHWMRAALYDATRAVLDRQLIPMAMHSSQMETAGTGDNGRRAEDTRYAGGAPRFSGDFQRYMRYVLPRLVREMGTHRRRWFDNRYVVDVLRRDPRIGPDAVMGFTAMFRDGATWETAAAAAGHAGDALWLWRRLEAFQFRLRTLFRKTQEDEA